MVYSGFDEDFSLGEVAQLFVEAGGLNLGIQPYGLQPCLARMAFERGGRRLVTYENAVHPVVRVWDSSLEDARDMWQEAAWGRSASTPS